MPTPKAFDFRRDYPELLGFIYTTHFKEMAANPTGWQLWWRRPRAGEEQVPTPILAMESPGEEWHAVDGVNPAWMTKEKFVQAAMAKMYELPLLPSETWKTTYVAIGPMCWGKGDLPETAIHKCKLNKPSAMTVKPGTYDVRVFKVVGLRGISDFDGRITYDETGSCEQIDTVKMRITRR